MTPAQIGHDAMRDTPVSQALARQHAPALSV